jgi:hypothetical protein
MAKSPSKKTTSKKVSKKITKKTTKKTTKKATKARKPNALRNALHETLIRLISRPNGATLADISAAKFNAPAIQALRLVERRGYKTSVVKKPGELTRYIAKRAAGA